MSALKSAVAVLAMLVATMLPSMAWADAWQSPVGLSSSGQNAYYPQTVVDSTGVSTTVWQRSNGTNTIIQASRCVDGAWSTPVDLSAAGANAQAPQLAVDASGVVTAIWRRSNGSEFIAQVARFENGS